ncbi:AsmA family protein [Vreelandella sulfidaeris]|uniref:AsmA family protein n=1 Tax=Vreelandella sulfidaeris TaxID=115553 RepID=UPI0035EBC7A8
MMKVASKRLLWGLVPVVLVALIILAVELMSWNFLKPVITDRIEQATGRSAAIHGDVGVSLFPSPQLSVNDLEIDNPGWASAPHLLTAEQVTITPSLSDLLQGNMTLEAIDFSDASLNLQQRADAPANWALGDNQQQTQQPPNGEASSSSFDIPSLSASNSTVRYWKADTENPLEASISSLQMQTSDEELHTQATLTLQQPPFQPSSQSSTSQSQRFELEAHTDTIADFLDEEEAFSGDVSLSAGESRLTSTFEIPQAPALQQLTADSELSLHNLAEWAQWLGLPELALERLDIAAQLAREGSEWRLHDIDTSVANSQLSGELTIDTGGDVPALTGQLHAAPLDLAALRSALPNGEDQPGLSIPAFPAMRGDVSLSADRVILEQATLSNLQAELQLADHSLALTPLTFDIAGGHVEANGALTSNSEQIDANAQISVQQLDMSEVDPALPLGDTLNADISLELQPIEQQPSITSETLISHLSIGNAQFNYRNQDANTHLEGNLETTGEQEPPELLLNVNGAWRDKPLELQARGAPLTQLINIDDITLRHDYPLHIDATSNAIEVEADMTLASILSPQTIDAEMTLEADSAQQLENWLGPVLPPLPGFRLSGQLVRDHDQWRATNLDGRIGSTQVTGSIEVLTTDRPVVEIDLETGRINLDRLISATIPPSSEGPDNDSMLAPLRTFDGELALSASSLVLPNGLVLGDVMVDASLQEGRLQAEPFQFRLGGGLVTAALDLNATQPPASGQLDIGFNDVALSALGDTFTPLEDRLGRASGELHLDISEALPRDRRDDLLLPFIGRLSFEPSQLRFSDPQAGTDLTIQFETQGIATGEQTFQLNAEGRYDGAPASISLEGDPLLDVRDSDRPYAIDLEADIVDTLISLEGTLQRPLALEGLNLALAIEGPNPQRLSRLLGISLPKLPPYSVSGELDLEDQRWTFTDMHGVIGDSDLNGRLTLNPSATPLHLTGELFSEHLDIADLGVLAGASPEETDDRFILPDTDIVTDAWLGLSADVSYRGESVSAGEVPLKDVFIDFTLDDGRGRFTPLSFGVGEGNVNLTLDLDASTQPPSGTMQVEVQGVDLDDALRNWELGDDSIGVIGGRGKLWIEGSSIAELLASADGGVVMLMNGGRLEALLVEIAGLDAGQTFLSWVRDRNAIPIDCAYADLQARDGVTQLDTFVVDTGDTTFTAGGQVDLNSERLDISIIAHPKDPSVFVGRSPLHLAGTFDNIELGVHRETLIMRAGASVAFGALAGPITALLPLVDVGTGPDVEYCDGLIRRSRDALQEGDIQ